MKRRLFIIEIFLLTFLVFCYNLNAEKPLTIPALREWTDSEGEFIFNSSTKIVINPVYQMELYNDALTFKEDLLLLKGVDLEIVTAENAGDGDIFMTLGSLDTIIGKEGYILEIADRIKISSITSTGAFYGTRTILQLLKNSNIIKSGKARDWALKPERTLMVDNGRKYFTIKWLENHIKELSYIKMNFFEFYISDNQDFRLECTTYPEITSKEHYTKKEITELQKLAKKYHVNITPIIDMPGHMGAILKPFINLYALKEDNGGISTTFLDITLDSARAFARSIMIEYLELFEGPYWHLGVDEYKYTNFTGYPQFEEYAKSKYGINAVPLDAIFDFVNWANSIVKSYGKTMRIYNDAINSKNKNQLSTVTEIDKDIIIDYWEGQDQPQQYIDEGYKIKNCSSNFFYYNLGSGWCIYNFYLYERWFPNIFEALKPVNPNSQNNLGSNFHIWCNQPDLETEGHIANEIRNTLRVLSTKLWSDSKLVENFLDFVKICDTIGLAPGVEFPKNPMPGNLCYGKKAVASSTSLDSIYEPDFIIDGSYNSSWKSMPGLQEWIYVDLLDTFKIDTIKIAWIWDQAYGYKIQTSVNAIDWETIFIDTTKSIDIANAILDKTRILYVLPQDASGRFVRILFNGEYNKNGNILWELEVYGKLKDTIDSVINKPDIEANLKSYPNPFNSVINIDYNVISPGQVKLVVYDINGNQTAEIINSYHTEGRHNISWDASSLPIGEYFCRMIESGKTTSVKMIYMK